MSKAARKDVGVVDGVHLKNRVEVPLQWRKISVYEGMDMPTIVGE